MQTDLTYYKKKWLVMASVSFGSFMVNFDISIVNTTLPTIAKALDADFAIAQWVILALIFPVASLAISIGRIGDIIGKKPLYLTGFFLFSAGSFLCGMTHTISWLLGFRIIQGIGAAMTAALGIAILTEAFPEKERGKALGILVAVISASTIAGPISGGILTDFFSWRFIFFTDFAIGTTGIFMVIKFITNTEPPEKTTFDFTGASLIFISLLSLLLAMTFGQKTGFGSPLVLLFFTGFSLSALLFVIVEFRTEAPIIDLKLFKNKFLKVGIINALTIFIGMGGFSILIPFYLAKVLLLSPLKIGFLMGLGSIAMAIASIISGRLSDRFGPRSITIVSLFILMFGYYTSSGLDHEIGITAYILRTLPLGIGFGVFMASNFTSITGDIPVRQRGTASALIPVVNTTGHMTGTAIIGSIWAILVSHYASDKVYTKIIEAPAIAQASALQDILLIMMAISGLLLILNICFSRTRERHKA